MGSDSGKKIRLLLLMPGETQSSNSSFIILAVEIRSKSNLTIGHSYFEILTMVLIVLLPKLHSHIYISMSSCF